TSTACQTGRSKLRHYKCLRMYESRVNLRKRLGGRIYRITIYLEYGGGDHHGGVPRVGGAALPHPQVRGRRRRGGASRGPRAAAVPSFAGASRAPGGRGSDHWPAGGAAGAEAS